MGIFLLLAVQGLSQCYDRITGKIEVMEDNQLLYVTLSHNANNLVHHFVCVRHNTFGRFPMKR